MTDTETRVVPVEPGDANPRRSYALLWTGQFVAVAGLTVLIPLLPFYFVGLGLGHADAALWTGLALAAPAVTQALSGPFWGRVGDRYGRKAMVVRAQLGLAVAIGLMALASTPAQFLVFRLLQGAFGGVVGANAAFASSLAPPGKQGRALGALFGATGAGSLIGPLAGSLVAGWFGFATLFGVVAVLLLVVSACSAVLLREPAAARLARAVERPVPLRTAARLLAGTAPSRALLLAGFVAQSAVYALVVVFAPRVEQITASGREATVWVGTLQAVMWATALIGALWWGWGNDRWRPQWSFTIAAAGCALVVAAQGLPTDPESLLPLRLAQGFCLAGLTQSVLCVMSRQAPETGKGALLGLTNGFIESGQIIGPLVGWLLATSLSPLGAFTVIGVIFAVAAILASYSGSSRHDQNTAAERATLTALLNSFLRETGRHDPRVAGSRFEVALPSTGSVLSGQVTHWSPTGHHLYGTTFWVDGAGVSERELVELLVWEAQDVAGVRNDTLLHRISDSVRRMGRYLEQPRSAPPGEPRALTRYAEQSVRLGHPMHPTPKSAEGFSDGDLGAYAPELGAEFPLRYFAIHPQLLREHRVAPGEWIPEPVRAAAARKLGRRRGDYRLLPVHPWQARYLRSQPAFQNWVADGRLLPLGALGAAVYPTSSVRTVCDPAFSTAWKLPLHVRITNFLRTNPMEHVHRATDASRVIAELRRHWAGTGLTVLIETGYRTVHHPELSAELSVLFRENPFANSATAPQVLAALLECRPGGEPDLAPYLREAGGGPVEWLRRYLDVAVLPILAIWTHHGVSLEAHVQNTLLHLEDGWPARCYVRDMEGVSVSRQRLVHDHLVAVNSPVCYEDGQAWSRLKYYLITNNLGHVIHVLSRCGQVPETRLWHVVAEVFAGQGSSYLSDLVREPTLPAKANLISQLQGRGESPRYIDLPNPMCEAAR